MPLQVGGEGVQDQWEGRVLAAYALHAESGVVGPGLEQVVQPVAAVAAAGGAEWEAVGVLEWSWTW